MVIVSIANHEHMALKLTRDQCLNYFAELETNILQLIISDHLYTEATNGEFKFYPERLLHDDTKPFR